MNLEAMGAELRRVRLGRGLSIKTVAEEMYISSTQIWRLEKGMKGSGIWNVEVLEDWCRYYGIELVDLIKVGMEE